MADYYSILSRAMSAPEAKNATWRRDVYDRARQMLVSQLRARRPPASRGELEREQSALDAAIERVETEMLRSGGGTVGRDEADGVPEEKSGPIAAPFRLGNASWNATWLVLAVVVAALGAGTYAYWAARAPKPAPQPTASATPTAPPAAAPSKPAAPAPQKTAAATSKDGDLPPGVDGGSTDADMAYVFRRQPTFYRTLQPVGTVIIDKLQHFLYLIRPNNVALRYGIGVGAQCADLAGLRHIAGMAEWPQWQPPPEMLSRNPSALPGGPGNPLGARLLELDDAKSRIHGTNAPKTIGTSVIFGCFRLVNDDIVDLYRRVQVNTPVIVN